jgi:hypothetical protein
MSCHDGTDAQAPDIVASGSAANPNDTVATPYTSKYGSGAGFFQSDYLTAPSACAHSLQANQTVTAPLSTNYTKSGGMVCSDCHDPHGNSNFRNLLPNPNPNNPASLSIVVGTQVAESVPVNSTVPNAKVAYDSGNLSYFAQNNLSAWCANCHNQLSQNTAGASPAHFKGHPSDVEIGSAGAHTDISNWQSGLQGTTTGFGASVGDATAGIPRLPYGSATGSNTATASTDTVFCLSCHKAHGSKYKNALLWPYAEGGADSFSGCQQCHYE